MNLIEKFWELKGVEYGISIEEFKLICYSPFKYIKKAISTGLMIDLRIIYLGEFKVSSARLKYNKSSLEEGYIKGNISEVVYNKRMTILNNYKNKKNKDEKK